MYEIEVKSPIEMTKDPGRMEDISLKLVRFLKERGAFESGTKEQIDTYLAHPCRDFASTDESVRIRTETLGEVRKVKVTYKGPKVSMKSKTREEIEMDIVQSPETVGSLFRALGFSSVAEVRKTRVSLELDGAKLCVDSVYGLGVFLEAELVGPTFEEAEVRLFLLLRELGFEAQERRSYLELLLEG